MYQLLKRQGKNIVGVFTVPDQNGRPDPLAAQAEKDGVQLFKFQRWRQKGIFFQTILLQIFRSPFLSRSTSPRCL